MDPKSFRVFQETGPRTEMKILVYLGSVLFACYSALVLEDLEWRTCRSFKPRLWSNTLCGIDWNVLWRNRHGCGGLSWSCSCCGWAMSLAFWNLVVINFLKGIPENINVADSVFYKVYSEHILSRHILSCHIISFHVTWYPKFLNTCTP